MGGSAGKDGGSGGGPVDAAPPPPIDGGPPVPPPNGTCPDFVTGNVTFNPAGGARQVAITMGDASKTGGPLIVYWHATGSNPTEPTRTGGGLPVSAVAAAGGIIAAPHDVPNAGTFPWLSNYTLHDTLFDEIFACAVQKTKISPARVHTLGFSAGGMMATHLSFARSKSLASVAAYSGGGSAGWQDMNNKFATMIITGGTTDIFGGTTNFYTMGQTWQTTLKNAGHFAMFCDHGGGHRLPGAAVVGGVFQFFMDHPYGTNPSPYAGGKIPSAISICKE
jgi:poly(3-hydroxybutyrate) depolymerase